MRKLSIIIAALMMLGTITSAVASPAFLAHIQIPESESMLFFGIGLFLLAKAAEKSKDQYFPKSGKLKAGPSGSAFFISPPGQSKPL
jgi:hypothetical protein